MQGLINTGYKSVEIRINICFYLVSINMVDENTENKFKKIQIVGKRLERT